MGLRGEKGRGSQWEQRRRSDMDGITAEQTNEGKGLSVQTSLFWQRQNFQILRKEKKSQLRGSEAQTVHKLFLVLGESDGMSFIQE